MCSWDDIQLHGMKLALLTFIATALWVSSTPVIARSDTPIRDYPKSNRGTCMRFKDHPAPVRGGSLEEVKRFCANEGITI